MVNDRWEERHVKHLPLPPTAQEQAEFDIFKAEFDSLIEQGEARGWIDTMGDGWWPTRPKPAGYTQREETDEEMQTRLSSIMGRTMWQMQKNLLAHWAAQQPVLEKLGQKQTVKETVDGIRHVTFPVHTRRPDHD